MNPGIEKQFQLKWGKLSALSWGDSSGTPVLALHGWLDNAASFIPLVPHLTPALNLIAVDFAGHGHSDHRPMGATYYLADFVTDVLSIMDTMKWEQCDLIGHSMGGAIAGLLAAGVPGRIRRLVLLEALGPLSSDPEKAGKNFRDFVEKWHALQTKAPPIYSSIERPIALRLAVGEIKESSVRIMAERGTIEVKGGVTWRSDPRLRIPTPVRAVEPQVESLLKEIACPTLVIQASRGLPLKPEQWEGRRNAVRNLAYLQVDGGHHVHMDSPELVGPAIASFLSAP